MARRPTPEASIGQRIRERRQLRGWSIRYTAERAGIAHTTLSRIERGLLSADNRFLLADIAAALECEATDLTGVPLTPADPQLVAAQAAVPAIQLALMETDLDEPPMVSPRPMPSLEQETDLIRDLQTRADYAGVGARLPGLLRELHAIVARGGPDRSAALRCMVHAAHDVNFTLRELGHPAGSWMAAERCWQAAQALGESVELGAAAFARAHAAIGTGAHLRGFRIAAAAADALEPQRKTHALPMLGLLKLTSAFAARGLHRHDDSRALATEAADLARRTGETDWMGFGPTNVGIWSVSMETDGGSPDQAVKIAAQINPAQVRGLPSRAITFHVDTARALARLGQDKAAIRHLLTAERHGPQMVRSSALVRETIRTLLDRARREAGGVELRGLCERVGVPLQ